MKIIGHRGAGGLAPENTIAAIRKALEYRVDEIEVDIRVSKDGQPVLHHDAALTYATGKELTIRNGTLEELRQNKPDLAELSEAIEAVGKQCPLILEVKPHEPVPPVTALVQRYLDSGWRPQISGLHRSVSAPCLICTLRSRSFRLL